MNSASENAETLEECRALAEAGEYMSFSFNADKGKCYGVTEETAAGCANPVADESQKWYYYEFWCSEGYTTGDVCEADKVEKKRACDVAEEFMYADSMSLEDCLYDADMAGLDYFSYNKKTDMCYLPEESTDGGFTECVTNAQGGNANKKSKTYMLNCFEVEFIGKDYYCGATEYPTITMVAPETKCADVSTADALPLTIAECNDFAYQEGYDWFTYREDQGLCWYGATEAENESCRTYGQSSGKQWDIYATCGLTSEMLSDEQNACVGKEDCMGEECFVMWYDEEQSWKCDGASQAHSGEHFEVCVDYVMSEGLTWMNYRTNNGACAGLDECVPQQSGSNWQILLNCAEVEMP